ncbi:MAG: phosphatase PAP2 family protein [Pseudomonadota bacterium]|nr:phosphatase PAP2 family protein [Pseudomonadota bacterium]
MERARSTLLLAACGVGLATALIFLVSPRIDMAVARLFLLDTGGFVFNYPGIGMDLRVLFKLLFWFGLGIALLGVGLSIWRRELFRLDAPRWIFLASCLALGPGIAANVVLKDNWGRARPFHVEELGGTRQFTPPLLRSDQCQDNCSFVSGEASSIYMLFFALALLFPASSGRLFGSGVVLGTAAGLVRMAQGGHFLSDVIFAGVFMALIAAGLHCLLFDHGLGRRASDALLRLRSHAGGAVR